MEDVINIGKEELEIPSAKIKEIFNLKTGDFENERLKTKIDEFDLVLGGGFVKDSLTLFSGEPGIGKSTLTLQICKNLCDQGKNILYISGEESIEQISMRAKRLQIKNQNLKLINSTNLESILATLKGLKFDFIVIDSIQVVQSDLIPGLAGSISQVRYCAEQLLNFAKNEKITILLIGHVTKDGDLAGPKTLEHLVDIVLNLEGDRYHEFRMLKSSKNRFGSCSEIGIFEMTNEGLKEVLNPSSKFIESRQKNAVGSCLSVAIEGNRSFIIEVQALTNITAFGYPKRTASGFDVNRLNLLIAVLQKHADINLSNQDVYINIVGGLKVKDPAIDLAVCLSIISSFKKSPLPENLVAIGEIGLCGEVRKVNQKEKREKEVKKMNLKIIEEMKGIEEYRRKLI